MKKEITLTYAKAHLSEVLNSVEKGVSVYIKRNNKRVAVLSPFKQTRQKRKFGQWKGKIKIADDFDELPEDILKAFGAWP